MSQVPGALRAWFVAHAVVDVAFAVPLFLAPEFVLALFRWHPVDPAASRLVAAALLAIGAQSWVGRHDAPATYRAMLNLKIVWSCAAIVALVIAIAEGASPFAWAFLGLFATFGAAWARFRWALREPIAR